MNDEVIIPEKLFVKRGRMKKSPLSMQPAELNAWEEQESKYVKAYLFSIGQPLVHKKEGVMVAEYSDGNIKKL